jgi:hypothetical protein
MSYLNDTKVHTSHAAHQAAHLDREFRGVLEEFEVMAALGKADPTAAEARRKELGYRLLHMERTLREVKDSTVAAHHCALRL